MRKNKYSEGQIMTDVERAEDLLPKARLPQVHHSIDYIFLSSKRCTFVPSIMLPHTPAQSDIAVKMIHSPDAKEISSEESNVPQCGLLLGHPGISMEVSFGSFPSFTLDFMNIQSPNHMNQNSHLALVGKKKKIYTSCANRLQNYKQPASLKTRILTFCRDF